MGTKVNLDSPQKLTFPAGGNRHFSKFLLAGPPTSQGRVQGDDVGATGQPWHFNSLSTCRNECIRVKTINVFFNLVLDIMEIIYYTCYDKP